MYEFTSYNYAYFLETSEILLGNAKLNIEKQFYYCLASIAFSAFTIEAFVNHCGVHKEKAMWIKWDTTPPYPRFDLKLERLGVPKSTFADPLKKIFDLRNYIAHARPDTVTYNKIKNDSNLNAMLINSFQKEITLEKAEYYLCLTKDFIKHVNEKSGCNFTEIDLFYIFGEGGGTY